MQIAMIQIGPRSTSDVPKCAIGASTIRAQALLNVPICTNLCRKVPYCALTQKRENEPTARQRRQCDATCDTFSSSAMSASSVGWTSFHNAASPATSKASLAVHSYCLSCSTAFGPAWLGARDNLLAEKSRAVHRHRRLDHRAAVRLGKTPAFFRLPRSRCNWRDRSDTSPALRAESSTAPTVSSDWP